MKSLMLAVTSARLAALAWARIWSPASPKEGRVGYNGQHVMAFGA
jgi:hypothetical protein